MTLAAFLSAVLGLLLTPGPTNTLMGLAGAAGGFPRVLRLIPAELLGYLAAILPLAFAGKRLLADHPALAQVVTLAAAVWVLFLAIKLWGKAALAQVQGTVTARRVFLTTLLNPKALIVGLVLLPAPAAAQFPGQLALFCLTACIVASIWGGAGALVGGGKDAPGRTRVLQRAASVWLGMVSVMLVAGVLRP